MSPEQAEQRSRLHVAITALIAELAAGQRDDAARDALLGQLFHYQREWVLPYARFCAQKISTPERSAYAEQTHVPALPTDAFRFARISSQPEAAAMRTFQSSGTTQSERSQHDFADLTLYDQAAYAAARHMLFPDVQRMRLLILAPHERELPDSSLSYMLTRFTEWFGTDGSRHVWPIDADRVRDLRVEFEQIIEEGEPVALLGTSFAFVHALDALAGQRFVLPYGSRVMQTGGFKGRSREIAPDEMRAYIATSLGLYDPFIIAEYGMTELSSQLYETTLREAVLRLPATPRGLWSPGWLRASVVHPESLLPLPEGELGLVRLDDPANLDSVSAIQTADLARLEQGKLFLQGRASQAVARGCSITADQLLDRANRA